MVRYFLLVFAAVFLVSAILHLNLIPLEAMDQASCETDCSKCHTISNEEIKEILKKLKAPDAEILKVQDSPLRGLWEVSIDNKGRRGLFYVDFSKGFVVSGSIIELKSGKNKTTEQITRLQESRRVDFSKIPLNQALVMGDPVAPRKVAVFTDPDCPYCSKLHKEMGRVLQQRKDIVFYILLYPIYKDSYWKAKSITCKKSLKMLEDAFDKKTIPKVDCETNEIESNIKLAQGFGITGTPSLVLPDGRVHTGWMPAKELMDFIDGIQKTGTK